MLALRFIADLFLLFYLGGHTSFSTATNNTDYINWLSHWSRFELAQLSTSSYFASQASKFTYSIPYGQPQECDIYGPLCQTGSITVAVNLTNVTTATVLPCSSYLILQSYYLRAAGDLYEGDYYQDHWYTSFGRSPQCTSFAQAYSRGQFTLSNCGNKNTVINIDLSPYGADPGGIPSLQQPSGMLREFSMNYLGTCCGNCTVDISEGRLYYFPDNTSTDCRSDETYNSTLLSAGNLEKRAESIIANANIAVVSGNTFTSPSLYLEVLGTEGLHDKCDTVGPNLTNHPIVTFPPGALSTWKPPPPTAYDYDVYVLGKVWRNGNAFVGGDDGTFAPLDVRDLACPTWGLARSTASDGSVITTIGPPFLPLLKPNTQIFSLDPTWARLCAGLNLETYLDTHSFVILDPPMALTPKAMMVPTSDNAPKLTPRPHPADPTTLADPPVTSSTSPARPISGPVNPQKSPTNAGDPSKGGATTKPSPVQPKLPEPAFPVESQRHPADLSSSQIGDPDKPLEASKVQPASLLESTDPVFQQGDTRHSQTQGLGAMIYNALGRSGNEPSRDTGSVDTITLPNAGVQEFHVGGTQTLSVNSLGVQVDGVAYSAGGPPLTFSGKVFTFVPQPNNYDRYSDRPSGPPSEPFNDPRPFSSVLSIAGQPITLIPSRMLVAGSTILPGGPPITLSNTPLSLDSSGILLYGSSSILLSPQSIFTIQSQPITANAAGSVIKGGSISPGGSTQTMDGTIMSLDQSGQLAIDNTLISSPTPETHHLAGSEIMIAGQTVTPDPSEFTIAGTPIRAGGPAATVGGTVISLQTSGILIVGSTTMQLSALQTSPSFTLSLDGLTAQRTSSSLAVIEGVTLTPGKAGVPVTGSVAGLEKGEKTLDPVAGSLIGSKEGGKTLDPITGIIFGSKEGGKTLDPVTGSVVGSKEEGKTLDVGSAGVAIPTGGTNQVSAMTVFKGGQEKDTQVQVSMIRVVEVWAVWLLLA